MIGKHIHNPKGHSSFKGLNDYITGKTNNRQADEKIAFTDCINLASVETAIVEMESLAFQNKRCADPVMHLLLSWRENEVPTTEQVNEAVKITLDELNVSQCQAVYSLHQNTDNLHLHICVNRIDPETTKAITPAKGWTRRAMEHAARRIEYIQSWQIENNVWSKVGSLGHVVQKPITSDVKIPQEVQDAENLTGEQSAVRKTHEALKDAIKMIHSWNELHVLMHSNGMEYQKKGSGAVIHVGEIIIKASDVSRNLSLNKLEKLFGEYQAPTANLETNAEAAAKIKISIPKPLSKSNDNENWRVYITARKEYYSDKKQRREQLTMTHQEAAKAMKDRQRDERKALSETMKKNTYPKYEFYRRRSVLASKHAYESVVLKTPHKAQRDELQKKLPIFHPYEQWLIEHGLIGEADAWRHRKDKEYLQLENPNRLNAETLNVEHCGLLGFTMTQTTQGLRFANEETPKIASFIDTGRVIRVYANDDDTLFAALQLAQEKWGGVHLNGTDEYKRRCAEVAERNGIRITNPELQKTQQENIPITKPRSVNSMARELAQNKLGKPIKIVTSAMNGRNYSGVLLGVIENENHVYAVQAISDAHLILHNVSRDDLPKVEAFIGRRAEITNDDYRIKSITEPRQLDRSRSWGR
ncbi:hypothetical protein AGMMS49957_01650 [Synergistales bacterium]|nr:hypothetical protein AGMMS49957_01650 [Synergistales bacterium]